MAPLNSIVQAAGRCNRNNEKNEQASVFVVEFEDDKETKSIYGEIQVNLTREMLKNNPNISESKLYESLSQYEQDLQGRIYRGQSISTEIEQTLSEYRTKDATALFKLIENDKENVYLELDSISKNLLSELNALDSKKPANNKERFTINRQKMEIYKKLQEYCISDFKVYVPTKDYLDEISNLKIIREKNLEKYYNTTQFVGTGFIRKKSHEVDFSERYI